MKHLKGRAIVGQSGGCTAVINQSLAGVVGAALASKSITDVWGMLHGMRGFLAENFVDLAAQPKTLFRNVCLLPSAALGSSRHKLQNSEEPQVVRNLKKANIRYLFMIGGNDTAETILRIANAAERENYELRAIHIPKTIDNDLVETDHSPGYGSVARFAAITTQEAGLDTKAMRHVDPVKIIELMGRNSGWIVAASTLLKQTKDDPPHLLLLPEIPFDERDFLKHVENSLMRIGHCVVVISETIRDARGQRIGAMREGVTEDPFGHQYVEGTANVLTRLVEKNLKVRARYDKPGTIQRMSIPYISGVDQKEAYEAGRHAVRWALKGQSKVMVSLVRKTGTQYGMDYKPVALEKIPGREYHMPDSFLSADKTHTTSAFLKYALPLIGSPLPQFPSLKK